VGTASYCGLYVTSEDAALRILALAAQKAKEISEEVAQISVSHIV
jgi:hypothetical protein